MNTINLTVVYNNIKTLSKQLNIRMSEIEEDAGVSPGYMSRLAQKNGDTANTALLGVIASAAKKLFISIESVLFADVSNMSPEEEKMLQFITKLLDDTEKGKFHWKQDSEESIKENIDKRRGSHPLFVTEKSYAPDIDTYMDITLFDSKCNQSASVLGTIRSTKFIKQNEWTNSEIILVRAKIPGTSSYMHDEAFELYIYQKSIASDKTKLIPLCNAEKRKKEALFNALDSLYDAAGTSSRTLSFDQETENLIDKYLFS